MTDTEKELFYINLGTIIKEFRVKSGLSQEGFANLLGLSRVSIVNIEKGRQRIGIHQLYEISRILNTDIQDLIPLHKSTDDLNPVWVRRIVDSSKGDSQNEEILKQFLKTITTNK